MADVARCVIDVVVRPAIDRGVSPAHARKVLRWMLSVAKADVLRLTAPF